MTPNRSMWYALAAAVLVLLGPARPGPVRSAAAQAHAHSESATARDSAEAAATVLCFHEALSAGDSATALRLLAPGAVVLESGESETRAEYRAHHLTADIVFARATKTERGPIRVRVSGQTAWATSTSATTGEYEGRKIDSLGAELMVLSHTADGWRIEAIHWSSRRR